MRKQSKVAVKITQDDIDKGIPKQCCECPVAIALKRMYPHTFFVNVNFFHVNLYNRASVQEFTMCEDMFKFTVEFDNGQPVVPMTVHMIPIVGKK
jgi:hypothetical protein